MPPSKSVVQRVLLAASRARGATVLRGLGDPADEPADVAAARGVAAALGAVLTRVPPGPDGGAGDLTVTPQAEHRVSAEPAGSPGADGDVWELGESATLARLATAVAALARPPGTFTVLTAVGTLLGRSSAPLFTALRSAGSELGCGGAPDGWPVRVRATSPPETLRLHEPVSSQEVSALLLSTAAQAGAFRVVIHGPIPSRPYVDLSTALLASFGVRIDERVVTDGTEFLVHGPLQAPREPLSIEPDASAAAVALAAACLSGGEVRVPGLTPNAQQGDVRIVEHLNAMGCVATLDAEGLRARGAPQHGAHLDLAGEPDLAPVLAAVAAAVALRAASGEVREANGSRQHATSTLSGLAALPAKESDRLSVLATGLSAAGLEIRVTRDALQIAPASPSAEEIRLDPAGDHRMAFAFGLLGLVRPGVRVLDSDCVSKSWPGFWRELERLGARRFVG